MMVLMFNIWYREKNIGVLANLFISRYFVLFITYFSIMHFIYRVCTRNAFIYVSIRDHHYSILYGAFYSYSF